MENKEIKNDRAEEISDEALDEVTGGVTASRSLESKVKGTTQKSGVKTPSGTVTIPTQPVGGNKKF